MGLRGPKPKRFCKRGHDQIIHGHLDKKYTGCKTCRLEAGRAYSKRRYAEEPDWMAKRHLRRNWGMTPEDKQRLIESQNGKCAICKNTYFGPRGPQIDHNHVTGKIRGILCQKCNRGLGLFEDNQQFLQDAIIYLQREFK